MICFLSPKLTYKNSILHYKAIKVMINALNFAKVIFDIVVCHHDFSDLAIVIEVILNVVVYQHSFPGCY